MKSAKWWLCHILLDAETELEEGADRMKGSHAPSASPAPF